MPTFMIMNNPYGSVPSTPLDLRTTHRDRGIGDGGVPAETPGPAGSADLWHTTAAEHRWAPASTSFARQDVRPGPPPSPRTPTNSQSKTPSWTDPGNNRRASDRRTASKLPLRKRPFPPEVEPLEQSSVPPDRPPDRLLAETTDTWQRRSPPADVTAPETNARWTSEPAPAAAPAAAAAAAAPARKYRSVDSPNPHTLPPFGDTLYYAPAYYEAPPPPLRPRQRPHLSRVDMAMHQDEDGDTPLHIAVVQGNEAVVQDLLHIMVAACKNLNIFNKLRQTPLHLAVITQHEALVEDLLRAGADPAALDRLGRTALHLCCEYGLADCLATVLSHVSPSSSSCLNGMTFEGLSPLHVAVKGGHKDLVRILLDTGAKINIKDIKSGQSPLMYAVESNNVDMIQFLIESGSDVNGQSNSGNTALHGACGRGHMDTVWLLLKNGADSGIKNNHNDTPVMVAKNKKIADVLRGKSPRTSRPTSGSVIITQ